MSFPPNINRIDLLLEDSVMKQFSFKPFFSYSIIKADILCVD
jgi:hypothetical protein